MDSGLEDGEMGQSGCVDLDCDDSANLACVMMGADGFYDPDDNGLSIVGNNFLNNKIFAVKNRLSEGIQHEMNDNFISGNKRP